MNSFPDPARQHAEVSVLSGHIPIDAYILLAVMSVLIITATLLVVMRLMDTWLIGIMHTLLVLSALYCLAVAIWRGVSAAGHASTAHSVATSASLGSLSFGLFAAMFVNENRVAESRIGLLLIAVAMGASIAAIVLLGFVLLHEWRDKKKITEPLGEEPPQTKKQVALPSQLPPRYPAKTDQLYPSQQTELRRPVGPQGGLEPDILLSPTSEALSPLFEDDPLFAIPHPANIHLFMQIRNNDIMVNGEDACAISPDETRLALCDGVSVSNFSRPWAMLLAQQWVTHPLTEYDAEALEAWLDEPRKRWQEWVLTTWLPAINKRNPSLGYKTFSRQEAEERIEEGAASTFLGISLDKVATTWSAVAFGDTCLFHFSPNNANNWSVKYFPMHTAADFSDRPASISSSLRVNPFALTMHLKHQEGTYKAGDTLLMATDAFAMWLFKQLEQRTLEAAKLLQLTSKENFAILVDQERAKKQMNNDDTTLLIVPL